MAVGRLPAQRPADLAAAVDGAAESLVLMLGRSAADLHPRMSPPQLRALLVLERRQSIHLGELAAELGTIPSSASRLCDRLQAAGLLVRRVGELDRRAICLELTPEATKLLDRIREARRAQLTAALERMSPGGRTALLSGLAEFASVVGDVEKPGEPAVTTAQAPPHPNQDEKGGLAG